MRRALLALGTCLALGCAGETAATSTLTAVEGEGTHRIDVEPVITVTPAAASDRPLVEIHPIEAGAAEDGDGHTVQASAPIAIDLDARAFPPRALDPVLTIGQRVFTHYRHPHVGVMRFILADASLLVRGQTMSVHYARDASDARVVVESIGDDELRAAGQP